MTSFFDFQKELNETKRPSRPKPPEAPGDVLTITQLTFEIERAFKTSFPTSVLVKGEVSNFKLHNGSGHAYFTLKDAGACINCVMFKSDFVRVKFDPVDGMEMLATGRLGVYPQRGSYQLYITRLEPLGQGALELAFRQLCEKLQNEGLFAPERKRPIPAYPARIALITSRETAALQDMLKVLRRFPFLRLFLYHVPVQGESAAPGIAAAIRSLSARAARLGGIDVILLSRGGGSLEDLWPFNEEIVARAIVASSIPVVTGVGHEIDVSIADLVADHHAHTPTEAAQVIVSRWRNAQDDLVAFAARLRGASRSTVKHARERITGIARHEFFRRPADRLLNSRQRLDDLQQQLDGAMGRRLSQQRQHLGDLTLRLARRHPQHLLAHRRELLAAFQLRLQCYHPSQLRRLGSARINSQSARLDAVVQASLRTRSQQIDSLSRHLNAVGPNQVLARGYSITSLKKGGAILRSKDQLKGGERLLTRLADGEVESVAEDPRQPTLFE